MPAMRFFKKRYLWALLGLLVLFFSYRAQYEVPVLMYHHINEDTSLPTNVTPKAFEKQMEFLKVHRFHVIGLGELLERIKRKERIPFKTVAITFDDGNLDNMTHAFPVLKRMGFPATIFMITRSIGEEGWLSEEDLKILDESGIEIGSHTVSHAYLPELSADQAKWEITQSKKTLEKVLERPVRLFSYPAGGFTEDAKRFVEEAGYLGAVTTNRGSGKHDPYALRRVKVTQGKDRLFGFWAKVSGIYYLGKKKVHPG